MIERFRAYLDKDFNKVARTIPVDDLYEELLGALMDKADEAEKSGVPQEEIFDYCVDNFGDYTEALKSLDKENRSQKKYILKKLTLGALWTIVWFLGMTIVYLVASFTSRRWDITWVAMVGAAVLYGMTLLGINIAVSYKNKWFLLFRFSCALFLIVINIIIYFIYSGVTGEWGVSWLFMVNIPIIGLLTDMGAALIIGQKVYLIEVLIAVLFASVSIFLITAVLFFGFRMTWLFVMGGIFIDLVLIGLRKLLRSKNDRQTKDIEDIG